MRQRLPGGLQPVSIITRKQGRNPDTSETTSSPLITLSSLAELLKESLTNQKEGQHLPLCPTEVPFPPRCTDLISASSLTINLSELPPPRGAPPVMCRVRTRRASPCSWAQSLKPKGPRGLELGSGQGRGPGDIHSQGIQVLSKHTQRVILGYQKVSTGSPTRPEATMP